jgi:tetratricopeptide (TPR) repeat protein
MDFAKAYEVQSDLHLGDIEKELNKVEQELNKALTTVFKLAHQDLQEDGALFEYYYTALALRNSLEEFCKLDDHDKKEGFFSDNIFHQTNARTKAQIYSRLLRYEDALKWKLEELEITKEALGEEDVKVALCCNNIGYTYGALGDYRKALEYHKKALEIDQKSLGDDHPNVASSYNNIGYTYGSLGDHRKALEYHKKALEIDQKSFGEDHPAVATSYNNIGGTYGDLGDHNKALEYHEKALERLKKSLGDDHPDVATSYNNIGSTYGSLGDHKKALEYKEKALERLKKSLGDDHPDVATSYNNIGYHYGSLGDHNKALEYKEKALVIQQKSLDQDHPTVALSYNNIGGTYGALGDHNKALEYKEKALERLKKSLGDDHPDVATSYNNIGGTYGELGDHNKALEYKEKALVIQQKSLGQDHPTVALSYNNIGSTYGSLGDHNKALEYLKQALEIRKKSLGQDHPNTMICKHNISQIYRHLAQYQEALAELEGILSIYKKAKHPDQIIQYSNEIAQIKRIKNFYEEANKLLEDNSIVSGKSYNETAKVVNNLKTALDQFRKCNHFKQSDAIDEKILQTLGLLIKAQNSLYQNSTKNKLAIRKQLNEYQKEYDELKKSIDDKQVRLAEIEEYLAEQKQIKDAQSEVELANNTLSTIEKHSSFEDMPEKVEGAVRVASYNITADFFDNKDNTADQHHHWKYRAPFVKVLLKGLYPDIMCLQELSAQQALELHQYFNREGGYKSIFLSQTPSEVETGAIACGEQVQEWSNKFLGASLIGTFINKSFEFIETGRFWLNETPHLVPTAQDRGEIDKGFGNMNTYRAVLWAKVKMEGNKSLYIFNSHYPLSGNNETRFKCAELEMDKIREIAKGSAWVSVGDKNIICMIHRDCFNF